ncbi:S-layer homology domain-containing protein [Paenibacillus sp. HB172176]|uniref:S-layer homology domain-containing protein n=1 Tax=Paenibacillus sp. HB172176 TaxID=2493690 RepID=UPI001439FB53|nr:S-layer homology domain-containing protein [Paenibacillus sp. HB172176]
MEGKRGLTTVKRYIAMLLVVMFVLSPLKSYAAAAFALELSAEEVLRGGELTIHGTTSNTVDDVVVKIVSPEGAVFYVDTLLPVEGGYSVTVGIPADENLAPYGSYTVIAGAGSEKATKSFRVVESLGGGEGDGDGNNGGDSDNGGNGDGSGDSENGGNNGGVTTPPTDEPGIPVDTGTADGSNLQPEEAEDGHFQIGSSIVKQAMNDGDAAITIHLPSSAASSGKALDLPADTLDALQRQNKNLVITSGELTLSFPAGSLPATPADEQGRIRIVLNTAWSDEASGIVHDSISKQQDYTATGVVLSASIELISGGASTSIHEMKKPVKVSIKLSKEQEALIQDELAGVYYVDGNNAQYVGGAIHNGEISFMAEHFSYYAILEYDKSFTDLRGHWSENAVKRLAAKHIVTGVDEQHYAPELDITRADFVTLIMRAMEGERETAASGNANAFSDVIPGQYYTEYVAAAAELGIVTGYDGKFRPADKITREEAAVALMRAASYFDLNAAVNEGEPPYADRAAVSAWAEEAVKDAWSFGLMQGDGMSFNPKHAVTRAEVAAVINRLIGS